MADPKYPVVTIKPSEKTGKGKRAVFDAYIRAHPGLKPYAQLIWQSAVKYDVDPVYYASLINLESGGNPKAKSSAGAVGLAQIHMGTWLGKPDPRDGHIITRAEIENPTWNAQFGAWYFKQNLNKYGSYDAAYRQGYNNGYTGKVFTDIPKGYVVQGGHQSPQEAAQTSIETGHAKQTLTDPWVVVDKKGHVSYVKADTPPKNVLKDAGGAPVSKSVFFAQMRSLNDIYVPYTGKPATAKDVADFFRKPISQYQLQQKLASLPGFNKSPLWKTQAPGYEAVWHKIFGDQSTPDQGMLTYAIVHNLGGDGFANEIRKKPQYLQSNEFKGTATTFQGVYEQIYGKPDQKGLNTIREAAYQGWSPEQFAAYLRAQPEYTSTPEYQTKAINFLGELGLITGGTPVLTPGKPPLNTARPGAPLPDTSFVPGAPGLPQGDGLVAGYGK